MKNETFPRQITNSVVLDQNLTGFGLGLGGILKLQGLGTSRLIDYNCFHGRHTSREFVNCGTRL